MMPIIAKRPFLSSAFRFLACERWSAPRQRSGRAAVVWRLEEDRARGETGPVTGGGGGGGSAARSQLTGSAQRAQAQHLIS